MNRLVDLGVAGFRVDTVKVSHNWSVEASQLPIFKFL